MTKAVSVGLGLAALLFMKRMIDLSGSRLIGGRHPEQDVPLPKGLVVYEVLGPLFFGAAHKAMSQINAFDRKDTQIVIIDLAAVPVMDATGIENLDSAIDRLKSAGIAVLLTGLQSQPIEALAKARLIGEPGAIASYRTLSQGLEAARGQLAIPPAS
jgi:SulP family sulfate permease